MTGPRQKPKFVKVSLNLRVDELETLKRFAKKHGTTVTRQFQDAIAMHKLVDEVLEEGGKILIEDKKGKMKGLKFFR